MSFSNINEIGIKCDDIDALGGISHIFTTKNGGCSAGPLSSLNMGVNRPDNRKNLINNYKTVCGEICADYTKTVLSHQTHTANIKIVTEEDAGKGLYLPSDIRDTDGLVTNVKNLPLVIFYADCVPILLYSKDASCIACVHAGWRGTVAGIAANAAAIMETSFGADAGEIRAAIGPSIGQCHFETGLEVAAEFEENGLFDCIEYKNDKAYIDLWRANTEILVSAGLKEENIFVSGLCTVCNTDKFFSHRGLGADTGRMALIAYLSDQH